MKGFRPSTSVRKALDDYAAVQAEAKRVTVMKAYVEAWTSDTVAGDAALGRTGSCFGTAPQDSITQADRRAMLERGIVCYAGSGNYFQADLTGEKPRIIQRRPLAQRFIELVPGGNA